MNNKKTKIKNIKNYQIEVSWDGGAPDCSVTIRTRKGGFCSFCLGNYRLVDWAEAYRKKGDFNIAIALYRQGITPAPQNNRWQEWVKFVCS